MHLRACIGDGIKNFFNYVQRDGAWKQCIFPAEFEESWKDVETKVEEIPKEEKEASSGSMARYHCSLGHEPARLPPWNSSLPSPHCNPKMYGIAYNQRYASSASFCFLYTLETLLFQVYS